MSNAYSDSRSEITAHQPSFYGSPHCPFINSACMLEHCGKYRALVRPVPNKRESVYGQCCAVAFVESQKTTGEHR